MILDRGSGYFLMQSSLSMVQEVLQILVLQLVPPKHLLQNGTQMPSTHPRTQHTQVLTFTHTTCAHNRVYVHMQLCTFITSVVCVCKCNVYLVQTFAGLSGTWSSKLLLTAIVGEWVCDTL